MTEFSNSVADTQPFGSAREYAKSSPLSIIRRGSIACRRALGSNVTLLLRRSSGNPAEGNDLSEYYNAIEQYPEGSFDIIVIRRRAGLMRPWRRNTIEK
jgi:hypothetical protein